MTVTAPGPATLPNKLSVDICWLDEGGLPWWLSGKQSTCQTGDLGSILGEIPWLRKLQPTLVYLTEKSHGQRSMAGYSSWSCRRVRRDIQQQHEWRHAAVAKSLQSCLTLCDPRDGSPPGSHVPGILQARTLEWVAISFSNAWKWKVNVKWLSRVRLLATPWTAAYQAPPSMGFSRQEYWSGVPLPSPNESISDSNCMTYLFL